MDLMNHRNRKYGFAKHFVVHKQNSLSNTRPYLTNVIITREPYIIRTSNFNLLSLQRFSTYSMTEQFTNSSQIIRSKYSLWINNIMNKPKLVFNHKFIHIFTHFINHFQDLKCKLIETSLKHTKCTKPTAEKKEKCLNVTEMAMWSKLVQSSRSFSQHSNQVIINKFRNANVV